jgi:hypothetical protein
MATLYIVAIRLWRDWLRMSQIRKMQCLTLPKRTYRAPSRAAFESPNPTTGKAREARALRQPQASDVIEQLLAPV